MAKLSGNSLGAGLLTLAGGLVRASSERGTERLRRAFLSALASFASRFSAMILLIVTVPLALHHLDAERFGMWMILSSLGAIMIFADLGIGNGVLNQIAAASGHDDAEAIREITSSALVILVAIGAVIALASVAAFFFVDCASLLGVDSALARAEAPWCVLILGLCLAAGVPLSLGNKVQLGLQQGYAANLWAGFGGLLALASVTLAIVLDEGTPILVLALFGSQQLAMAFNSIHVFFFKHPDFMPRRMAFMRNRAKALCALGSSFFILQLVVVIGYRVDSVIVAHFFGAEQAGGYVVYERMFSLIGLFISLAVLSLWPAYGEAIARGDKAWVAATFWRSLFGAMGFACVLGIIVSWQHDWLIDLWLGRAIVLPLALVLGMAAWQVLQAFGAASAALLNGIGAIRVQVIAAVAMGISSITLKFVLAPSYGLSVIIWCTVIAYMVCSVVPALVVIVRRVGAPSAALPGRSRARTGS